MATQVAAFKACAKQRLFGDAHGADCETLQGALRSARDAWREEYGTQPYALHYSATLTLRSADSATQPRAVGIDDVERALEDMGMGPGILAPFVH